MGKFLTLFLLHPCLCSTVATLDALAGVLPDMLRQLAATEAEQERDAAQAASVSTGSTPANNQKQV